jgi:protein TonB
MTKPNDTLYLPYGAYELKAYYQRNLLLATGLVLCLVTLVFGAVSVWAGRHEQEQAVLLEGEEDGEITIVIDLGPEPSIERKGPPDVGETPPGDLPEYVPPEPVPDNEITDDTMAILPTQKKRTQLVDQGEPGSGDGDGSLPYVRGGLNRLPPPDGFVPREIEPELIYQAQPEYPRIARLAGVEGVVWMKVLVGTDGIVLDARVAKSSGAVSLDEAATAAAYKNRFSPAIQNGRPVAVWVTYRVEFVLSQ